MKRIKRAVSAAVFVGAAVLLYRPVSILIFHIREPKFLCPIDSNGGLKIRNDGRGSGEFGSKRRGGRMHMGIDIQAKVGTPVKASKSGRAFIGKKGVGMGKHVILRHPDGTKSVYGHLSKILVSNGRNVRRGDIIGQVGKTGNAWYRSIIPHLHFEIRVGDEAVDPLAGYMKVQGAIENTHYANGASARGRR